MTLKVNVIFFMKTKMNVTFNKTLNVTQKQFLIACVATIKALVIQLNQNYNDFQRMKINFDKYNSIQNQKWMSMLEDMHAR